MNAQLIEQWLNFCSGDKAIDKGDFYTIFFEDITDEELNKILSPFEFSSDLKDRILSVKQRKTLSLPIEKRSEHVLKYINDDVNVKKNICTNNCDGELNDILRNTKITFVDEVEFDQVKNSEGAWPNEEVMDIIGDFLRDEIVDYSEKVSVLTEAFYGLTTDYNLVWYLMTPFYGESFKNSSYFKLWCFGVEYVITDTGVYAWDRFK